MKAKREREEEEAFLLSKGYTVFSLSLSLVLFSFFPFLFLHSPLAYYLYGCQYFYTEFTGCSPFPPLVVCVCLTFPLSLSLSACVFLFSFELRARSLTDLLNLHLYKYYQLVHHFGTFGFYLLISCCCCSYAVVARIGFIFFHSVFKNGPLCSARLR
jgi:hypothetical protein